MSYNFDGKVANQLARSRKFTSSQCLCEKCRKLIDAPKKELILIDDREFIVNHYLNKDSLIYETKSGTSVVYCSEYCRNKHNHRFNRGESK
jgi:hypothetical protein